MVGSGVVGYLAGRSRTGIDVVVHAAQEAGVVAEPVAAETRAGTPAASTLPFRRPRVCGPLSPRKWIFLEATPFPFARRRAGRLRPGRSRVPSEGLPLSTWPAQT